MPTDKELMQQALDALEYAEKHHGGDDCYADTIEAIRARLSQCDRCGEANPAEIHTCTPQEPVAWISHNAGLYHGKPDESLNSLPLYTTPPQREWQGLTDEEYEAMAETYVTNCYFDTLKYARAIEAKLKEKNT